MALCYPSKYVRGVFTPSALRPTGLGVTDQKLKMGELESLKGVRHCTVKLEKKKKRKKKVKIQLVCQVYVVCFKVQKAKFDMCKWKN